MSDYNRGSEHATCMTSVTESRSSVTLASPAVSIAATVAASSDCIKHDSFSNAEPTAGPTNSSYHQLYNKGCPEGGGADVAHPRRWLATRSSPRQRESFTPHPLSLSGGGTHSSAYQSSSTSYFCVDGSTAAAAVDCEGTNHSDNRMEQDVFASLQPAQSCMHEGSAASASVPLPEVLRCSTSADASDVQLTALEVQEPNDPSWGMPCAVVLRHRMGFSTVVLTAHQRRTYSRNDLENFVLYKEQKYNAVNVLWRLCMLLLFILTIGVFCLAFSTSTAEWVALKRTDDYLFLGLFVACHSRGLSVCSSRVSSRLEWTVTDAVTGSTLCTASADFVRRYIGAIWAMAILQLLCELIALMLTVWIAARPTRSGALAVLFFDLLLGTASGIVAVVLFQHYSSCLRRTCEGDHLSGPLCSVSWRYGYRLYLSALAVHGVLLLLALCINSYIQNIRVTARNQLRAERRRSSRRHTEAEEYMMRVMDGTVGEAGCQGNCDGVGRQRDDDAAFDQHILDEAHRRLMTHCEARDGAEGVEPVDGVSTVPKDQQQLAHSSLHVSFADAPGARGMPRASSRGRRNTGGGGAAAAPQRPSSLRGEQSTPYRSGSNITSGRGDAEAAAMTSSLAEGPTADSGLHSESSLNTSFTPQRRHRDQRPRRRRGSPPHRSDAHSGPPHRHVLLSASCAAKRPSAETAAYTHSRKRSRFFARFFQREYDANYLTAAELGVPIAGATDWVYDDHSDMYYSFERNMFWDPLTHEYYNCVLKTWQESPDQVVEVRDALDYVMPESESEEERGGVEDEQAGQETSEGYHSDLDGDVDTNDGTL
ncbi:hypothetical protein ABL78_0999 [Leptomonas seymouri]|uniref:Transmembrane protein n=1 Tax=Leptomonas seymouri TaxID=5684 RepID=A0A0N0P8U4_LEPSE|nr:hypothetical protein ABL78_0999 [Leptomonas seymouri]|eukprot:KPI89927.1 hypothetical protein ABL78_0999 [Leptomonas seymouri]